MKTSSKSSSSRNWALPWFAVAEDGRVAMREASSVERYYSLRELEDEARRRGLQVYIAGNLILLSLHEIERYQ